MVELILDVAVKVLNGIVLIVDEVQVAVDGVLVEVVVLFGGRREVEVGNDFVYQRMERKCDCYDFVWTTHSTTTCREEQRRTI